jgi:uncharacterized protein
MADSAPHHLSHLALESLHDAGWQGQGNLPLQALPRLSAELHQPQGQLFWSLALGQRAGADGRAQLWLQAHAHAELPLLCQRCLQPMVWPLQVQQDYRFVPTEAQAEAEDAEAEEDVLAWQPTLDALSLLEDEALLALPAFPVHPQGTPGCGPQAAPADPNQTPHPFAALAALRKG